MANPHSWRLGRGPLRIGSSVPALGLLLTMAACGGGGGSGGDGGSSGGGGAVTPTPVATPQLVSLGLSGGTGNVLRYSSDIDDQGRVAVVFGQTNGTRDALQAVVAVPGAAGQVPSVGTVGTVDTVATAWNPESAFVLAMSPSGNAVVVWESIGPCDANTYKVTGTDCKFFYSARRLAGGSWEPPVLLGDSPEPVTNALINDQGDILVSWPGWQRLGTTGYRVRSGAAWLQSGRTAFRHLVLNDLELPGSATVALSLSSTGNMLLVTTALVNGVTDIVAYRGSQSAGFGPAESLDSSPATVSLEGVWGGVGGQAVVVWQQQDGASISRRAAHLSSAGAPWSETTLQSFASAPPTGALRGSLSDSGEFALYDWSSCQVRRFQGGVWAPAATTMPAGACDTSAAVRTVFARHGDVFSARVGLPNGGANTGQWQNYQLRTNSLTPAYGNLPENFLYGVPSTVQGSVLLSENNIAAMLSLNGFQSLPSATAPAGAPSTVARLWLTYVKMP